MFIKLLTVVCSRLVLKKTMSLILGCFIIITLSSYIIIAASALSPYRSSRLTHIDANLRPVHHEIYQRCKHTICNDAPDYPKYQIKEAMTNKVELEGMFGTVLQSSFNVTLFENRFGFSNGLCATEGTITFRPKVMRNIEDQWKYIVNFDEFYQTFKSEICSKLDNKLSTRYENCRDFEAGCDQDFQEVLLLTYENKVIDFDRFLIPTTCNCRCNM